MSINYFEIAAITICLDANPAYIPAPFQAFATVKSEKPELIWTISSKEPPAISDFLTLVDSADNLIIQNTDNTLSVSFPRLDTVRRLDLSENKASLYLNPEKVWTCCPQLSAAAISYALETAFFYATQEKGLTAIHASTILYRGKAYLFSAPSGTGKTTHTKLWRTLYPNEIQMLNGDAAVCGFFYDIPSVWGLPWSGTSGIYRNLGSPIGGFIFLERANINRAVVLSQTDGWLRLAARCFTPSWTTDMMKVNFQNCELLSKQIPCYLLECLPDGTAVQEIRRLLDKNV